jgi:hypothetical protein
MLRPSSPAQNVRVPRERGVERCELPVLLPCNTYPVPMPLGCTSGSASTNSWCSCGVNSALGEVVGVTCTRDAAQHRWAFLGRTGRDRAETCVANTTLVTILC